jgi:prolyl-tRNA synthetase
MRYSKLFGKTTKDVAQDISMVSHQLLLKGGFIRESTAGRYYFLPLGMRVRDKMQDIVQAEMDGAGAQKMITPVLHPMELWKETNRNNSAGFELMAITDRRGMEFALGGTAEEMVVDLVRKFNISYKDLPFNIYQFSQKFRDEMRARGGLLRVREFLMKDAYSFHKDEEDFKREYKVMEDCYTRLYAAMGLDTKVVEADNGYIGGEYCHEFQVEHEKGEGRFFESEDGTYVAHEDVAQFDHVMQNEAEELMDMTQIEQPEWVQTMEDNIKHYSEPKWRYLKNVVYKSIHGDIYIASTRGDIEINKTKLEQLLDLVGQLEDATEEDLKAIGTKHGYVHSWGHDFLEARKSTDGKKDARVIYIADESLKHVKNFIGGQKEEATDTRYVNYGRDFKHEIEGDIAMAQGGFVFKGKTLVEKRGIEVGNIFQLGTHYTTKMSRALFTDNDGKTKPYYMGCYGIGMGRTLATIVEKHHDENGIIWPKSVAPYQIHLIHLGKDEEVVAAAQTLYEELLAEGYEVLWDDRKQGAGHKFKDADLIGLPLRLVVSGRNLEAGEVEWKERSASDSKQVKMSEVKAEVSQHFQA